MSDRFGRRPILLTGLIGNSVSLCLFGISKRLWWAIGSRALCGIVNGNSGVARSMVSEITDNTNKAKAFSIFGFCWGLGMIGPAIGGFLNRPAEQFPDIFGNCQFLKNFPYFLPCFVSAMGSLFGFTIGYLFLKESNPVVLQWKTGNKTTDPSVKNKIARPTISGSIRLVTKASYSVIFAYCLLTFYAMIFDEVLPLYSTAPVYAGGLGISSADFAKALSFFGVVQIALQFYVYPRLTKSISVLTLCRIGFLSYIPFYLLFPELSVLREWVNGGSASWVFRFGYVFLLFFRFLSNCLTYGGCGIMVSTSAAPEIIGTVNGLSLSCLSIVRALGPTVGGTLWSISLRDGNKFPLDRHLIYYLIAIMSLFSLIQSYFIPKSVDIGGKVNKNASK